jgi:hypothetical protein
MEENPGCLSLVWIPPALLLSTIVPGNHFVHHSFWGKFFDLLFSVAAVLAESGGVQSLCASLRAIALLQGRSGFGLLLVPFYPLAVLMYWLASMFAGSTGLGVVGHGFLGTVLGGTLVAGPVMAHWWAAGTMKYLAGIAEINRASREYYDDW